MISAAELRRVIAYSPETGELRWLKNINSRARAGALAGAKSSLKSKPYLRLRIDGQLYYAHRLAWLYVHGDLPEMIDHVSGDTLDNRMVNLRKATRQQNAFNAGRSKHNSSGFKGVHFSTQAGKYIAKICENGKSTHLGTFDDPAKAYEAYCAAASRIHGDYAHSSLTDGRKSHVR